MVAGSVEVGTGGSLGVLQTSWSSPGVQEVWCPRTWCRAEHSPVQEAGASQTWEGGEGLMEGWGLLESLSPAPHFFPVVTSGCEEGRNLSQAVVRGLDGGVVS